MNKQELIEKLKRHLIVMSEVEGSEYDKGYKYATKQHLAMIVELDEPEKLVVPQYVADFYESIKDSFEWSLYSLCIDFHKRELQEDLFDWFKLGVNKPIETLVKMKLYGYEVEKEQLYTVEIPNPNGDGYGVVYLGRNEYNKIELRIWDCYSSIEFADNWKQFDSAQLTESEIKEDFEWAWPFAKEVENDSFMGRTNDNINGTRKDI